MSDEALRMRELSMQGFGCSQILLLLALEAQGKNNPDLVRAISGLQGGLGYSGKVCGALTGACCLLALYAGRGTAEEAENGSLPRMIQTLVEWFQQEYTSKYGGIDCSVIIQGDARKRISRCPMIVAETLEKVKEILEDYDFDFDRDPHRSS